MLKNLPPGIINFSASSVPVVQLGLSGKGMSEQQLNDASQNFVRPQLITVAGAVVPNPYGGTRLPALLAPTVGVKERRRCHRRRLREHLRN